MKIAIDGKAINATEYHKDIYDNLIKEFGRQAFEGTIIADDEGNIAAINPTVKTSWAAILFLIELLISQKMFKIEDIRDEVGEIKTFMNQLNERVDEMEEKLNGITKNNNPPK